MCRLWLSPMSCGSRVDCTVVSAFELILIVEFRKVVFDGYF